MRGWREGLVEVGTGEGGDVDDVGVTCGKDGEGAGNDGGEGLLHNFARF